MTRYIDTVEHRATVYSLHSTPGMRDWTKQDFLTWLAEHDRQTAEKAWDEGFDAGERDVLQHDTFDEPCIPNPYRKETS